MDPHLPAGAAKGSPSMHRWRIDPAANTIGRMVNSEDVDRGTTVTSALVGSYAVIVLGTVVALAVLTGVAPRWAPPEAWGHAVVVAVFAALLPLRWRAARRGSARARRAVRIIAAVLLVVNLVEAFVPAFPLWMRV